MIRVIRTADIIPGKAHEALECARELAAYVREQHKVRIEVLRPIGGDPQRICWTSHFGSLAAFGAFGERLANDTRYWDLVARAADCFVPGAPRDEIWHCS